MIDQRAKFQSLSVKAELVGEAQDDKEVGKKVMKGEYQLVFITPESIIENTKFHRMLQSDEYRKQLVAVVVDEAHCIKTWSDKFRTSFCKIGELRSLIPTSVNILALTATATLVTYHIICERLSMSNPCLIALPPSRDNIRYQVKPKLGWRIWHLSFPIVYWREELTAQRQ